MCRQETGWCERELWDLAMDWGMCIRGLGRRTRVGSELPLLAWMVHKAGVSTVDEVGRLVYGHFSGILLGILRILRIYWDSFRLEIYPMRSF